MKRLLLVVLLSGILTLATGQEIFRSKWLGISVQDFSSTSSINRFSVTGPDGSGYVYLTAHSSTGSGDIVRTKWQGTAVQDFSPDRPIVGFETSGPDFEGYVTLTAVASDASKRDILRSKWLGTAVQAYSAPSGQAISGFAVSGPDPSGYVTLSVLTAPIGVEEEFDRGVRIPRSYALNSISPNPFFGQTKISYSIPRPSLVTLMVYDCTGRIVKKILKAEQEAGIYNCAWQATDEQGRRTGAGIYFLKMEAGEYKAVKKMVVVR